MKVTLRNAYKEAGLIAYKSRIPFLSSTYWTKAQTENGPSAHLYDGGLANMLCSGGAIQDSIAVWRPLDVAQPTGPVGVAHQVGVESDGIIAGITCGRNCLMWGDPIMYM